MMKILPIGKRLLLRKFIEVESKKGPLLIIPSDKEPDWIMIVEEIGSPDSFFSIGDKVLIEKYCGQEVKVEDEDYRIVKEEHIMALLED